MEQEYVRPNPTDRRQKGASAVSWWRVVASCYQSPSAPPTGMR